VSDPKAKTLALALCIVIGPALLLAVVLIRFRFGGPSPQAAATVALATSIALGLAGLFCLFAAAGSYCYPQSRTTVEKFPTDFQPPRRWLLILTCAGLGIALVVGGFCLFTQVYLPAIRLDDVEHNKSRLPRLTVEQILAWVDAHHVRARDAGLQGHCITLSRKKRHFRLAARTLSR
jgi:hypothetical protein